MRTMFITSSRKPSAKTRTLCKYLSRFTGASYVNRGKMGMQQLLESAGAEPLILVGEYHGNPGELGFYGKAGQLLFSLRFTESYSPGIESHRFRKLEPLFSGRGEIANALASFFPFDRIKEAPTDVPVMMVGEEEIDCMDEGKSLFKLNIKSFKRY